MKLKFLWVAALGLAAACARSGYAPVDGAALSERYAAAQISSGDNRPEVNVETDGLDAVLVLLHERRPLSVIAGALGTDAAGLAERLQALEAEGLIRRDDGGDWRPTFPVISIEDAERRFLVDDGVVASTLALVRAAMPEIRVAYDGIDGFRSVPFERASLFILSNVLLDNFQIDAVEREFLKAERPLRRGGRYYFTLYEREVGSDLDTMGIYGNHSSFNGELVVGLYGNRRYNGAPNFATIGAADLSGRCGFDASADPADSRDDLARDVVKLAKDRASEVPAARRACLEWLGIVDASGAPLIPVLSLADHEKLEAMARAFAPAYLALLESHGGALRAAYGRTPYAEEGVSFEEWAIWWYHFFYTEATDRMIEERMIEPAPEGVFTYVIEVNG